MTDYSTGSFLDALSSVLDTSSVLDISSVLDTGPTTTSKMGPKKDQLRIKTTKCPYNDRGYCKFGNECNNKHVDKVCNDRDCTEEVCDKRHPNPCKFGLRCKHNKKKLCSYSHVTFASDDGKINALEKKFEVLENLKRRMVWKKNLTRYWKTVWKRKKRE